MYDTILIPTDGSEPASRAAEHGFELADQHGATVHLFYAVEATDLGLAGRHGRLAGGAAAIDQDILSGLEEQGTTITDELADRAGAFGLETETAVRHGWPLRELLDYADEHGVDLIVMGTHGRSGIERVLLGSVTERVLRASDVPVLVIRTHE